MKSFRNQLPGLVLLLSFLFALGVTAGRVYRAVRQETLNHALIAATKRNDAAKVILLLSDGANPNSRDVPPDKRPLWRQFWDRLNGRSLQTGEGPTPLCLAMAANDLYEYPPENVPLVEALLKTGANVNIVPENGEPLLMAAVVAGKRETVRLLLQRGADVNAIDGNGYTALYYAAGSSDTALVQLLLTHGAFVNASNTHHEIPLDMAAFYGRTNIARLLVENGSKLDARDTEGDTPLADAVLADQADVVKLLIERGALVNTRDNQGHSPLQLAKDHKQAEIMKMLKKAGAKE